ncbi:hypothetical protein BN1051_00686 [Arthrobacter saudimassiliensis]|uniref:Uncharacterized protein n=1 Tax=Arthrobacter saudimassiliensis TaxID=1461584 RepID=A0A078MJ08_9MICC|nr:hypothetical protein BN1051_00686 [Arthrobacter saudimassiliensis]
MYDFSGAAFVGQGSLLGGNGSVEELAQELDAAAAGVDRIAGAAAGEGFVRWHSEAAEAFRDALADSVASVRAAADALMAAAAAVAAYSRVAEGPA